jgi:hypothetical protein
VQRRGLRKKSDREGLNARLEEIAHDTDKLVGLLIEIPLCWDGDNLSLTPNYPGFTGVKVASPRVLQLNPRKYKGWLRSCASRA